MTDDTPRLVRRQQVPDHVEDKQRAHAIIGKSFPHFRAEQKGKPRRMAEQGSFAFVRPRPVCGWITHAKDKERDI